jgi:hypothetical protein
MVLLHDQDVAVKRKAARALARTGKAAVGELGTLGVIRLAADDPELKAEIKDAEEVIRLAARVADPVKEYWDLTAAKEAFGPKEARRLYDGKQRVLQALYDALGSSSASDGCAEAVEALLDAAGRYQEPHDQKTREKACEYLVSLVRAKKLKADLVVPRLVKLISGKSPCLQAIDALGELGADAAPAVPALKQLEEDSHRSIREAASQALRKIETP